MNIKNLTKGSIIKNYKTMCEILKEDFKKCGNSRNSQLKDWERYFTWSKDGHKFIINNVYPEPKPKIDGRGKSKGSRNNNNIYGKYIEKLILDLLVQKYKSKSLKNRRIYLSKDSMLEALCMVNDNYSFSKTHRSHLINYIHTDNNNTKEFFNINNNNLLNAINRTLNSLENRCLINWQIVQTVALDECYTYIDDNDEEITLPENHRNATDDEREAILIAEKEVLDSMKYENKQTVYILDMYREFNKQVCRKLNDRGFNILYYYKSYDIVFHKYIIKAKEKIDKFLLEYEERNNVQITLNSIVSENLMKNANNRHIEAIELKHDKNKKVLGFDTRVNNYKDIEIQKRSDGRYMKDNQKITDTVINYHTQHLTHEMTRLFNKKNKEERELIDMFLKNID